jgi:hypothetical protein
MRKHSYLKILGIIGFCVAAFLVGLSLVHGAPGKVAKWQVQILPSLSLQALDLSGIPSSDRLYIGGQDGVTISDGAARCGSGADATNYTYLSFQISTPSQLLFMLGSPLDSGPGPQGNLCGFPGGSLSWPDCLFSFLNQPQPAQGYDRVYFFFATGACEDRGSTDFRLMPVNTWLRVSMDMRIVPLNYTGDCPTGCPDNHMVIGRAHGLDPGDGNFPDIYIYRDSFDSWTVHVSTNFDNPSYQDHPSPYLMFRDLIFETYCNCVLQNGKGGRKTWVWQSFDSAWVRTHLEFNIRFTKL